MFDHRNFALNGLFPGLVSTRSVANLGSFEIEIIIEPVVPRQLGGGGGYVPNARPDYKVKIRISTKTGKVWQYERIINNISARVLAKLLKVKPLEEPVITVYSVTNRNQPIDIKVTNK